MNYVELLKSFKYDILADGEKRALLYLLLQVNLDDELEKKYAVELGYICGLANIRYNMAAIEDFLARIDRGFGIYAKNNIADKSDITERWTGVLGHLEIDMGKNILIYSFRREFSIMLHSCLLGELTFISHQIKKARGSGYKTEYLYEKPKAKRYTNKKTAQEAAAAAQSDFSGEGYQE